MLLLFGNSNAARPLASSDSLEQQRRGMALPWSVDGADRPFSQFGRALQQQQQHKQRDASTRGSAQDLLLANPPGEEWHDVRLDPRQLKKVYLKGVRV